MKFERIYRTIAVALFIGVCGCGSQMDSTVQGTVTIDGELANRGTVAFYPAGGGAPAYGNIDKNGTYSLRVGQGNLRNEDASRIHSGDYVVTVVVNMAAQNGETVGDAGPPLPGPRMTAEVYATKETSPLHKAVKPGANVLPLELEGASHAEVPLAEKTDVGASDVAATPQNGKPAGEGAEGAKP